LNQTGVKIHKDIQKLKGKKEKHNYPEQYGTPNLKISENTDSDEEQEKQKNTEK
jgi:hypothetical protein